MFFLFILINLIILGIAIYTSRIGVEIENLQIFGAIKPINQAIGKDLYIDYFDDYDENIHDEYPINNILFLDKYLVNYIKSNIGDSIKSLLRMEDV